LLSLSPAKTDVRRFGSNPRHRSSPRTLIPFTNSQPHSGTATLSPIPGSLGEPPLRAPFRIVRLHIMPPVKPVHVVWRLSPVLAKTGIAHAASRLMWQKVCSWAITILIAGYSLALGGFAVSELRQWAAEPPTPHPPTPVPGQSKWTMHYFDDTNGWTTISADVKLGNK
jgi:hypothetical protein